MEDMPEGYPLPSLDAEGHIINEGDTIRIKTIPNHLLADYLSDEEKSNVQSCEGKEMVITEIDRYGLVWVEMILLHTDEEYNTHSALNLSL
jgi:hypothetical protein